MTDTEYISAAKKAVNRAVFARTDFLLTAGIVAVVLGLVIPALPMVLDVLIGASLSLMVVIIVVAMLGKEAKELAGFSQMLAIATLVRLCISVCSAKFVFQQGSGAILVEAVGRLANIGSKEWWVVLFPVIAIAVVIVIFQIMKRVNEKAQGFSYQMLPLKKATIENRKKLGLLTSEQVEILSSDLSIEARFYVSVSSIVRLIKCEAVIGVVIVVLTIAGALVAETLNNSEKGLYVSTVVGGGILWLMQAVLIAAGMGWVVGRTFANSSRVNLDESVNAERNIRNVRNIKTVINESRSFDEVEILNPEFARVQTEVQKKEPIEIEEISDDEIEQEMKNLPDLQKYSDDDYNKIVSDVDKLDRDKPRVILLGGRNYLELGVNVAVNVAIRLGQSQGRCLLIDIDSSRNAVYKVFLGEQYDRSAGDDNAVATCVENVYIWQGDLNDTYNGKILAEKINEFADDFDVVVVYAPNLSEAIKKSEIKNCISATFMFSDGIVSH